MRDRWKLFMIFTAGAILVPIRVEAQFAATTYHYFESRGPNSLNFGVGPGVLLGAMGPNGISGTATRDPNQSCGKAPLGFTLFNQAPLNSPGDAVARYALTSLDDICTGAWGLNLTANGQHISASTPTLEGVRVLPFVDNMSLASSANGRVHTFKWNPVADSVNVKVNIWDRSLMPAQPAQLRLSRTFAGNISTFVVDLDSVNSPFSSSLPYTIEIGVLSSRDAQPVLPDSSNLLSRSRTYFDFVLPAQPQTSDPVYLPIVEYVAGSPIYTFNITVDEAGTFVIDPDIAIGYVYQTGAGNPNFRTVTLPNVGDGNFSIEIFDVGTNQYRAPINAVAGQLIDFIAQGFAQGVSRFRVKGIEPAAGLDAGNPAAFPAALQFTGSGTFTGTMIPITGEKTAAQNLDCGIEFLGRLPGTQVVGPAQRRLMIDMLGLASRYQASLYRSLSLSALNSVISRVDGCALRGSPDTLSTHGGSGMDFVTSCAAQSLIYACLLDARAQFAPSPVR